MSKESSPERPVYLPDGETINAEYVSSTWGISPEFAMERVKFDMGEGRVFEGSVADMLKDTACPVGGKLSDAFEKKGIDGVVKRLESLVEDWDADFGEFEITKERIASEDVLTVDDVKKNQIFPTP